MANIPHTIPRTTCIVNTPHTFRYDHQEIALHSGLVLRECTKHDSIASIVLSDQKFFDFFVYVEVSTFDIASDAIVTFKVVKIKLSLTQSFGGFI